jgi:hypothetical protein
MGCGGKLGGGFIVCTLCKEPSLGWVFWDSYLMIPWGWFGVVGIGLGGEMRASMHWARLVRSFSV